VPQEVDIRRIVVQGKPGKKVSDSPISTNKLGGVPHSLSSEPGSRGRKLSVQG
jgi:hypothetical protein